MNGTAWGVERETGFEPATFSLARRRSSQLSYSRNESELKTYQEPLLLSNRMDFGIWVQ